MANASQHYSIVRNFPFFPIKKLRYNLPLIIAKTQIMNT